MSVSREIKFRARRIDDGRWVYGQYFKTPLTDENSGTSPESGWFFLSDGNTRHCIVQDSVSFVIDVKTLGQYTGLKDKNGNPIYEGDILSAVRYGTNIPAGVNRWKVYYNEECLTYYWINQEGIKEPFWEFNIGSVQYIIIGNIYENPELLEGNSNE